MTASTAVSDPERLDPALIRLAAIVLVGAMAAILDATIVNVAIPTLARDFHSQVATIQWVSTGYLLALAIVIPLTGWAVERFGSRRMWLLSLALFLTGSVLSGTAWSIGSLIAFRILQGLGGGMLLPLAQTILAQAAGPRRIGRVMAIIGIPAQLAPIVGPVIGGVIVDAASWRWIFFVNVPVCLIGIALALRGMPDAGEQRGRPRLDVLGLALLSPGLAAIVYGFSEAGSHGGFGATAVVVSLALGVVLLAAFTWHALRTRITPLIDVRLFKNRSFSASAALMFLLGASLFSAMLLLPLYEQQVHGASALGAGLLLAPQGLGTLIALVVVSRLADEAPPRPVVLVGMVLAVLGTVAFTQAGAHPSQALLGVSLFVRGAGIGAAFVPVMAAMYHGLDPAAIPRATSASRIFQQVGGSLGTAVLAVILQHQLGTHGADGAAAAFGATFWWALAFTAVAFVPAVLLPGGRVAAPARPAPDAENDAAPAAG